MVDLATAEVGGALLRVGADAVLRGLDAVDGFLDLEQLGADLLHLLGGDGEGLGDLGGAGALGVGLLVEGGGLVAPGLDLALTLDEDLGELAAAALHVGEAAVEDLDFLAALGELEAGLREGLAFHVALGAQRGDGRLQFVDTRAAGLDRLLGVDQLLAGAVEARLRLVAGGLELLELAVHALDALGELLDRALDVALLLLHGGEVLRGLEDLGALLLQAGLGLGEAKLERVDDLALRVVRDLVVGEGLGGVAQIDLALHEAGAALFAEAAEDGAARVHQLALGGGHGEKAKIGVGAPVGEEGAEIVGKVAAAQERDGGVVGIVTVEGIGGGAQAGRERHGLIWDL